MAISKELKSKLDDLIEQVKTGKIKTMQCLKILSPLLRDYKGDFAAYPTLHVAAAEGLIEVVKLLFKAKKYDFNWQAGKDNKTALMLAAEQGQLEVVKLLLTRPGINVNLTDSHGATALDLATKAGHSTIAAELINHGAKAGKENVSDNAKVQQEAFNRMQASNRAVLVNGNQTDEYEKIRALKAQRDALVAQHDALEAESQSILTKCNSLISTRETLVAEREAIVARCDYLMAERDRIERDANEQIMQAIDKLHINLTEVYTRQASSFAKA